MAASVPNPMGGARLSNERRIRAKPTRAKSRPSLIFCQLGGIIDDASAPDAPERESAAAQGSAKF
jgi:hypothetical protein